MQEKESVRNAMKARLGAMSARDRETESRIIAKELRTFLGTEPRHIGAYMHLSDEPDLDALLRELHRMGWTIALPCVEREKLVFRNVASFETLEKGRLNTLEPTTKDELTDCASLDIVLVPGRAFTREGLRMGRGNGGYDHWIKDQRSINPQTTCVGVCFERQIMNDVPMDLHDQKVDAVVTPRGVMTP